MKYNNAELKTLRTTVQWQPCVLLIVTAIVVYGIVLSDVFFCKVLMMLQIIMGFSDIRWYELDECGITKRKLYTSRRFLWQEVQDVFIAKWYEGKFSNHHVQSVVICKKRQRPFIDPQSADWGNHKWAMSFVLNSDKYPASQFFTQIDKKMFLEFAHKRDLIIFRYE